MTRTGDDSAPSLIVDLRRRPDSRMQLSRIAAGLFWADGIEGTRGEDIAARAGISTRTLWRYFRSKESCVEPVLEEIGALFPQFLSAWPLEQSLEEFLDERSAATIEYSEDQVHALRMIHLGRSVAALRSAWLMVCDDVERRCLPLVARRLDAPADDLEVREITAAVGGANRSLNDALAEQFVTTGRAPDVAVVTSALVRSVTRSSGGRLGPALADRRSAPDPRGGNP